MNETQGRSADLHAQSSTTVSADPSNASAGQLIRQARERKGISIEALAASLKVPTDKLKALEDDNWSRMPDTAFTRSLSLSICRVLQMDSAVIMDKLPKVGANRLSSNPEGINTPFKERALQSSSSADAGVWKIAAVLLLAAAALLAWYWLPQWWQDPNATDVTEMTDDASTDTGDAQDIPSSQPEPPITAAAATSTPTTSNEVPVAAPALNPQLITSAASVPAPTAGATVNAAVSAGATPAPSTADATPVPSPSDSVAPPQAVSETDTAQETTAAPVPVLRIKASGETWVQVRNAQRRVVAEKILKTGEVLETSSKIRPLSVVIGRADLATVEVEGAAFALPRTRDNVARFEVK